MSLASRIIFAISALLCASLCAWAALTFGEPATTPMWVMTAICVLVAVVVMLIRGPRPETLPHFRVETAREPTFRLVRSETGAKGEIGAAMGDTRTAGCILLGISAITILARLRSLKREG